MSVSKPRARLKSKRTLWWLVVLLVLGIGYWWFSGENTTAPGSKNTNVSGRMGGMAGLKTPVRAEAAVAGSVPQRIHAIGTVQAFNTVTVRSRVEGELVSIEFEEGQLVKAGDLLAQIDPRAYQVRLDQASGQLKQTEAQLKTAQADLQRYRRLGQQNSIAVQQVEAQESMVEQLKGSVQTNKAAVDDARLQLDYTKITAPITGRLGLRNLDVGNLVSASNTEGLVVITQTQPIAVGFSLPQHDLQSVFERMLTEGTLSVSVSDREGQSIAAGELLAVDNQIDVNTGTVRMKASFPNSNNRLFPNQFVSVSVLLGNQEGVVVPAQAVQTGSIGTYVYVVNERQQVSIRAVEAGITTGPSTVIVAGLAEGELVVTDGTDRLREGAPVEVLPDPVSDAVISSSRDAETIATASEKVRREARQSSEQGRRSTTTSP
ncbi:MdtA/MuxA family multidrug efflux RND transporter periplasmic adaptor subunit [Paenalcaligenes niemegkensis]|uniref:MdtA/MuxA family multidrug efflux RND transporter periplasmic adaptor subunit n=1 Tax=Paenalcaligenes niemegkensis TaxID=2895469 RepID=UPI001EE99E68|nr:MdtA/MuxA family multidrug efflux RND transporter periplasmic adaptor subunit [Paenalcaligenes niemegkensis]MCQ9615522.1 MdtA/MuxA family multidrug efflux RND transporter periplasmic adaptor subunit [Paenalcaligenes niemegkensis]